MAHSMGRRGGEAFTEAEARWADAIGDGDVFDPTSGWMRGYVIDLCNLRPLPQSLMADDAGLDPLGGLLWRVVGRRWRSGR